MKPCVVDKLGEILKIIISSQLHIVNIKMIKLSYEQAMELYQDKKEETNIA